MVATGFEGIDSTDFTVGSGAETAQFAGDAFSGRIGVGHLYRTGVFAWMVNAGGTGTIEFSGTADSVSMFARLRNNATTGALTVTAFDVNDQSLGEFTFTDPAAAFQELTYPSMVARIDFVNTTDQMISIDDFTADITALPVNQQPTFTAADPASVLEDAPAQSLAGFATFDPGAANESGQTVLAYTVSDVQNPSLFSSPPVINASGTLTYTPAPDAFGSSTFVVRVQDDGGTDNGGVDTSDPQTFTITVDGVNEAPTFEIADELTVQEDPGMQTVPDYVSDFNPGPKEDGGSTDSQILHDEGTNGTADPLSTDNNNPTDLGTLTRGSNIINGHVDAAKTVGDVDVFTFQIASGFELDGLFVLDYEYVTPPANSGERNAFLAINDSASFPYDANGLDINENPAFDETLFLGGTVFGLDDLPGAGGANILPRAGVVTGRGFTGPLGAGTYTVYVQQTGPANTYSLDFRVAEVAQKQTALAYTVSNLSDPTLFAEAPEIDVNGTLTFTPAENAFGTSTFDVVVQDTGGTANGGVDTSTVKVGTITVTSSNDPPVFTASNPPAVLEDSGEESVSFIASFVAGPADEVSQPLLGYQVVDVGNPSLFQTQPAIDIFGTLTYTPAADAFGTSTLVVTAQDGGGTDNGGVDTSDPQTFTITVNGVNEAPSFVIDDEVNVLEGTGAQTVLDFASGFDPGPNEGNVSTNSQVLHDEGTGGTVDPLSTDNDNPTGLGSLAEGSNVVRGFIDAANTVGNVDVFTFQVDPGFQLDGLFVLEYEYENPPANPNEQNAFLAINDDSSFPYNANELDINQNPSFDESLFLGGTVFGLGDLPSASGINILPRAGVITGRGFTGPLPSGTYTFYVQQTGPANSYALDLRVSESTKQSVLAYTVSNISDPSLFAVQPQIDIAGNLTFTPADDANGSATFDVVVQDDGGTENGGIDLSAAVPATITIAAVNDPPTFTAENPPTVLQDAGAQSIEGYVSEFVPGPMDEDGQTLLAYLLTNVSNTDLFQDGPDIDANGVLTYTPAVGAVGSSTFDLQVQDSGGTDNGGVDTSATQTFTINVIESLELTWEDPADISEGTPLSDQQLNAMANVPGTFVYTPDEGTVLAVGDDQELSVTFTPDDSLLSPQTITVMINVVATPIVDDFGDAPAGFPVLIADDGARHTVGTLFLGTRIDAELDGQPSSAADGDGAEDDGVQLITDLIAVDGETQVASAQVIASESGMLDAWIDFNGDGDWTDAGEQIATGQSLSAGTSVISFTIPVDAVAGDAAARFRLSTAGGLDVTGAAVDGEVEDYLFQLLDGANSPAVSVSIPAAESTTTIVIENGRLVVRGGSTELFRAAADRIGSLNLTGTSGDQSVTLDVSGGNVVPPGGLNLVGDGGEDILRIVGGGVELDFVSIGAVAAQGFRTIDLSDPSVNAIRIDAAAVRLLSATSMISIIGGQDDSITFEDADFWRMGDVSIVDGRFLRSVTNTAGSETVQVESPTAWQNVVRVSDVNNNGDVTAGDALRIINELARREFSDADTQDLDNPLGVTAWPDVYFDQNGDNRATALDALRVINDLARIALAGGEQVEAAIPQSTAVDQAIRQLSDLPSESKVAQQAPKLLGSFEVESQSQVRYPIAGIERSANSSLTESAVDELLSDGEI